MEISFSVRVVDDDGDSVEGAKVFIAYPWTWDEDYTDEDGWVEFEKDLMTSNGVRAKIHVNGDEVGEVFIEDGDTFSFTRP